MVIGHNAETAKFILTGNSIEDLERGLAEMKRQIANGITFSICYGEDSPNKSDFEKEYDSEYSDDCDCDIYTCCDDCDRCGGYDWNDVYEYDHEEDYAICEDCDEDCRDGLCPREVAEEEAHEKTEDNDLDDTVKAFLGAIKEILGI